jgi:hypothetical protein
MVSTLKVCVTDLHSQSLWSAPQVHYTIVLYYTISLHHTSAISQDSSHPWVISLNFMSNIKLEWYRRY